jgi:hypothetical protein
MPVLTEQPSMGDVLKYEVNPNYTREVITLLIGISYRGDPHIIPTGMHKAQSAQLEKQGQPQEPVEHLRRVRVADGEFIQNSLVLGSVLVGMRPYVAVIGGVSVLTELMIEECVQFVVTHDRDGLPLITHGTNAIKNRPVRAAHIDEITEKRRDTPLRMCPNPAVRHIAEGRERLRQTIDVRMNIGNDVVLVCHAKCKRSLWSTGFLTYPVLTPKPEIVRE